MPSRKLQMLSYVLNLDNPLRVVCNTTFLVPLHRIVCPGTIPETVDEVHVLIRDLIPLIMGDKFFAKGVSCGLRKASHHVPGDAAFGQVVQGAEGTSKRKRWDVACAPCYTKRNRFCDGL